MAKREITVVGAGLAGLTAAVNLAREGYDVKVLEKEERHGGRPEFRPDGAGSPLDLEAVEAFTGIDISPACNPVDILTFSVFGRNYEMAGGESSGTYMVERGPRSTSIDTLLYETAVRSGVEFEFGRAIKSPADVAELPEGSIVATGLEVSGFEAMAIPYVPFWGWFAKSATDDKRTLGWAFVDDFTVDYGFATVVNGTAFALLFQREKPLLESDKQKFEAAVAAEGVELAGWSDLFGGAAPHRSINNPVMFKNNMIVIGTLAGVMEPVMNFGMLGALISGRIGATAVRDRGRAFEEFKRLTSFFRRSLVAKRIHDLLPVPARRILWSAAAQAGARMPPEKREGAWRFVPGYGIF